MVREKYIGLLLTTNLNLSKHAKENSIEAKAALNIMWPKFYANQNIDLLSKYWAYNATGNCGVHAFEPFEEFKRLFRLLNSAPIYSMHVRNSSDILSEFRSSL